MKQFLIWLLVLFSLAVISVNLAPWSPKFEGGVYTAYTESVVQDFDLNIVNNLGNRKPWLVSTSYNFPDMHSHGVVLFWWPFYLYGKALQELGINELPTTRGFDDLQIAGLSLAGWFFCFLGILILQQWLGVFRQKSSWLVWSMLVLMPIGYYAFFEFAGSELTCFLAGVVFAVVLDKIRLQRTIDFFCFGVLITSFFVLKVSMIFFAPAILWKMLNNAGRVPRNWNGFLAGLSLPLIAYLINNYLQFDQLAPLTGYPSTMGDIPRIAQLVNLFLGPNGILISTPVLFLIAVRATQVWKNWRKLTVVGVEEILLICFCIKLIVITTAVTDSVTEYGMREFLVDVPIFVMVMTRLIREGNSTVRLWSKAILLLCLLWAPVYLGWYLWVSDSPVNRVGAFYPNSVEFISLAYQNVILRIQSIGWANIKGMLPFLPMAVVLAKALQSFSRWWAWLLNNWRVMALYFLLAYGLISAANLACNKEIVNQAKANGFFNGMVVANGFDAFLYEELLSEFGRSIEICKYQRDRACFNYFHKKLEIYLEAVKAQIVVDPIQFVKGFSAKNLRRTDFDGLDPDLLFKFSDLQISNELKVKKEIAR